MQSSSYKCYTIYMRHLHLSEESREDAKHGAPLDPIYKQALLRGRYTARYLRWLGVGVWGGYLTLGIVNGFIVSVPAPTWHVFFVLSLIPLASLWVWRDEQTRIFKWRSSTIYCSLSIAFCSGAWWYWQAAVVFVIVFLVTRHFDRSSKESDYIRTGDLLDTVNASRGRKPSRRQ